MKTVKDVSQITGVSIRTLRYYDEIGLLKPTALTEAGYRLYDNKALEKLQEIMFFRELEVPLMDIKKIMDHPNYDKEQALLAQKSLLEQKRNRLNGMIELITDVMKGVNTMSFGAFNNEEVQNMVNHTLACMSKENLDKQIQKYGNIEKYREYLISGFANEQAVTDLLKWYGSKEKAVDAVMQATGNTKEIMGEQEENAKIYKQFMTAKKADDMDLAHSAVEKLAKNYKTMFALDNARNILLDLAKEYLQNEKLAEITDRQFGKGCSAYVAHAIQHYYGASYLSKHLTQ
ncbi:MAG: MerR family transcriptional regulator [Eubacterium sp.]|nr:MerR family transcriptional regulator [Eubacterium sp.]